jgi:hypothetical protein
VLVVNMSDEAMKIPNEVVPYYYYNYYILHACDERLAWIKVCLVDVPLTF